MSIVALLNSRQNLQEQSAREPVSIHLSRLAPQGFAMRAQNLDLASQTVRHLSTQPLVVNNHRHLQASRNQTADSIRILEATSKHESHEIIPESEKHEV